MGKQILKAATFGDNLKHLRALLRMTQEEAAHRCGIPTSHFSQIELNNSIPKLDTVLKIARGLDIGADLLLDYGTNHICHQNDADAIIIDWLSKIDERDKTIVIGLIDILKKQKEIESEGNDY